MFSKKKQRKRKQSYALARTKANNKSKNTKVIIILASCIIAFSMIFAFVNYLPSNQKDFKYIIFGEEASSKVNDSFTITDLHLQDFKHDQFIFSDEDLIVLNEKEYSVKEAKKLNISIKDKLEIIDVYTEDVIEKKVLPFEKETKEEETIAKGQQILAQAGVDGEEIITFKLIYQNGVEFSKEEKGREISVASTKELLLIGVGETTTYTGPVDGGMNSGGSGNDNGVLNEPKEGNGENYSEPAPPPTTPPPSSDCTITVNGVEYPCQ